MSVSVSAVGQTGAPAHLVMAGGETHTPLLLQTITELRILSSSKYSVIKTAMHVVFHSKMVNHSLANSFEVWC